MADVVQIYHSRESRVAELCDEEQQVQLMDAREDVERIKDAFGILFEQVDKLDEASEQYLVEVLEEDEYNAKPLRTARNEMIEAWSNTQLALSKVAWVLKVDGNEAYQRMVNARKHSLIVDMSDL